MGDSGRLFTVTYGQWPACMLQVQPGGGVHAGRGERERVQGREGGALCSGVQLAGQGMKFINPHLKTQYATNIMSNKHHKRHCRL